MGPTSLARLAALAVVLAAVTACSAGNGGRPLTNGGGLSLGEAATEPGQITDFPVMVENTGSNPVTLMSVQLIALPGYPAPKIVRTGVLAEHRELMTSDHGWPIHRMPPLQGTWRTTPVRGFVVQPWTQARKRGPLPDMIEVGVVGSKPGVSYLMAGLLVTYLLGGRTYTQSIFTGGDACVVPPGTLANTKSTKSKNALQGCARAVDHANAALQKFVPR